MWRLKSKDLTYTPSGCAISGILNTKGQRFSGDMVVKSIATMRFRSNGLGGGFAGYGIYPDNADQYALHVMYQTDEAKQSTSKLIQSLFHIWREEPIPTVHVKEIENRPILWRYFVTARAETRDRFYDMTEDDIVIKIVFDINRDVEGAFVVSSGKNMGIFKGVGYPEDIAKFYKIEQYDGYLWTSHGRFPTNTPGWWGGAHPFGLLDWSIVHNGEVSSYGINMRYLASFGYDCTLQTDTEVIAYLFDLMVRKHGLPLDVACKVVAPPLWTQIDRMEPEEQEFYKAIRSVYAPALLNGPFSIVLGHRNGMIGLGDRVKLRPMIAASKGDMVYMSSEESAILAVCDSPEEVWSAEAGQPIVASLDGAAVAANAK